MNPNLSKAQIKNNAIRTLRSFKIDLTSDTCWLWPKNSINRGPTRRLHKLLVGPLPQDLNVCHHCDQPLCVRPSHWFIGTQQDNLLDMVKKGRGCNGRKQSPEVIEAKRARMTGRKHSEETKRKMSQARMGHPVSDETRKKLSLANKGQIISQAQREQISRTLKARYRNES